MKKSLLLSLVLLAGLSKTLLADSPTSLNLKVENAYSNPKEDVVIELLNAKDSSVVATTVSGKEKVIEFTGLSKGKYLLYTPNIGKNGFLSQAITVKSGKTVVVTEKILVDTKVEAEGIIVADAKK